MVRKLFFDLLPQDVLERLATFVRSNSYYDALNFAELSERQRQAMVAALNFKLVLNNAVKEDVEDWIAIFGGSVRTLDSSTLTRCDLPETFADLTNLSSAEVYGGNSHFRTINRSPELRKLRIMLHFQVDWDALIDACSTLPLNELCLECDWNSPCAFSRFCSYEDFERLANACQNVTRVEMKCNCDDTGCLWPLLESFKSLTHVAIHRGIQIIPTEFFRTLEKVEFHEDIPIRLLLDLEHRVTAITQIRRATEDTVALLAGFPNLKVLRLAMLDGAERALPSVVENVEKLDLSWCYDDFYDEKPDAGYGDGGVDFDKERTGYYPVDPFALQEITCSAQHLRELCLRRAVVKVDVVEKVLERLGKRLEKLSLHMDQQGEPHAFRLFRILQAAGRFCPNLKNLELLGPLVEKKATFMQKQRCYQALEILKKTAPYVLTYRLKQYINGIEEIPEM